MTALVKQDIRLPDIFSVTAEAEEDRNELLLRSREILVVTNAVEQNSAVEVARTLRSYLKEVEGTRKTLTEPLLRAQRLLKGLADDHCTPLLAEQSRIERLVTGFQERERARVAEEEAKRRAEIERLERQQRDAERVAAAAIERLERQREEAERAAVAEAAAARTAKQLAALAAADAQRAAQEEARLLEAAQVLDQIERANEASLAAIVAPLPMAEKSRGVATKRELRVEITDIHALYRSRPDLVRLEPNLAGIKATCVPEMLEMPAGIKLWWEMRTSTRAW